MKFAVLDFETYYSADYTPQKMTTEGYVRDPRFKTHCVAVKAMDAMPAPGDNPAHNTDVMDDATFRQVAHLTKDYAVVMQKASFDGLILSHHYSVRPAFYFDTLSMARLVFPHDKNHSLEALAKKFNLPPKIVPYNEFRGHRDLSPDLYQRLAAGAAHDVELTYIIFRNLVPLVPKSELRIIDMTIRMFTEPVLRLDYHGMEQYLEKLKLDKANLLQQLGVTREELQSSERFAEILRSLGVEPPTKPSPSNPDNRIYAFAKTDDEMKELCDDEDDRVSALCNARLGQKSTLNETRCERLLRMCERGSLTVPLRYYGAGASSRFSGEEKINFQNFPRSGEIRRCLMAPPGFVLLVGDLSQIECRMLNWFAGEQWVLDAFAQGRDIYSELASAFYQRQITKSPETAKERGMGKQVELSCGFGSGGPKIALTARRGTYGPPVFITNEEGTMWRDHYRRTHPNVVKLWSIGAQLMVTLFNGQQTSYGPLDIRDHRVIGPGGVWLDYSNLVYKGSDKRGRPDFAVARRKGESRIYGSKFIQNIIEFLSRLVLTSAMLEMNQHFKAITCTHDEGMFLVPEAQAEEAKAYLIKLLTTPPAWCLGIPLEAEVGYDVRYTK